MRLVTLFDRKISSIKRIWRKFDIINAAVSLFLTRRWKFVLLVKRPSLNHQVFLLLAFEVFVPLATSSITVAVHVIR